MKITLCDFQEEAVQDLAARVSQAKSAIGIHGGQHIISFSAPTGSGKTIMMMALFEIILYGSPCRPEIEPDEGMTILWLSDSPELNKQTLDKFYFRSSSSVLLGGRLVDASFDEHHFQPGLYFLNTQKIAKDKNLVQGGTDKRQYSIWETIENTVRGNPQSVLLVIDEAHRGTKSPADTKTAASTMQKFLMGSSADGLSPMPLIIGMTATPQRFNKLTESINSATIYKVAVPPDRVRESGLLKDHIYIRYPHAAMTPEMTILEAAADNWKDKCAHWDAYMEQTGGQPLSPIFVVQVENGTGKDPSATDMVACVQTIESRIGRTFHENEVVHTFNDYENKTIGTIRYMKPSAIDDDKDVKLVFFKENLSTGWDCPRAETMMSFRRAQDGTYIAQLLGRMVRTPLARRIAEDESLNDVSLYLPKFDKKTVEEVVKALQEEELPTDIDTSNRGSQPLTIPNLHNEDEMVQPDAPQPQTGGEEKPDAPDMKKPDAGEQPMLFPQDEDEPQKPVVKPQKPKPPAVKPEPKKPVLDRAKMFRVLNNAGLSTYTLSKTPRHTDFQSLLKLAHLLTRSGKVKEASNEVRRKFVRLIYNTVEDLKAAGKYEALAKEITDFRIESKIVDAFGTSIEDAAKMARQLVTSDADIKRQFDKAERQLGYEGIGAEYLKTHGKPDKLNDARLQVIVFMNDQCNMAKIDAESKELFNSFYKTARLKMKTALPEERIEFNNICNTASCIIPHNFELPSNIDFPQPEDGKVYHKHLLCNADGEAVIKLNDWEDGVLVEEAENEHFSCWLRNLERRPWALAIPYKKDGKDCLAYPDLIIIRKSGDAESGYVIDVLEPHDPSRTDNLPKAKGFAEYAKNDAQDLGRIQLIRKRGKEFLRLDLTELSVRGAVAEANTDEELTRVFEEYGITGTN